MYEAELIVTLISFALIDCLNPGTIATQTFLLLCTEKPQARAVAHVLGVYVAYFLIGFLIIFGLGEVFQQFMSANIGYTDYGILFTVGVILVCVGLEIKTDKKGESSLTKYLNKIRTINPAAVFLFGFASTFTDLPTAIPYFGAIALLTSVELSFLDVTTLLLLYNFIYVLPLVLLLGVYVCLHERYGGIFKRINNWINRWSGVVTKIFLVGTGTFLIVVSTAFFMGYPLL